MNQYTTSLYDELEWRGILYQVTDPSLRERLNRPITFYCGFDPTADSLHLGSLLPVITMKRFQDFGHKPLFLVGGATGLIGDPSGKTQERVLLTKDIVQKNIGGIQKVAEKFLKFEGPNAAKIVNNIDWIGSLSAIDFLRDVGKHFTVNMMLAKESVKGRIESRDHGISYTEFSYMILQSYDFLYLSKHQNCELQLGGSDQWGNITAGIDLIRRSNAESTTQSSKEERQPAFGITWPLVTKTDGSKFGKSEAGNIWLDANRTTPYQFYQYLLQTPDADVIRFLKLFTFKTQNEINALEKSVAENPQARVAQKELARELTALVHGAAEVSAVEAASSALFSGGSISEMSLDALKKAFSEAPSTTIKKTDLVQGISILDLLVTTGLCTSKGNARKDVEGGGIYLNQERLEDSKKVVQISSLLHDSVIVLRKGKKNYHLVIAT